MHNVARYRILERLGAGAAGGVYFVQDRVLGGAPLALKRMEAASDPQQRDSFAREFAVLASLSLPGVARVHDLGVIEASDEIPAGPFFTRDYVEGEPLDSWARTRAPSEIARAFLRVLETVGMLHRRGVVHGDLKPANIIVDARGMPHLIDFGLATRGAVSQSGSGTPVFMAPELFAGADSSMSADVYALGATLWTVVSGRAPLEELGSGLIVAKLRGDLPSIDRELGELRRLLLEAARWALQFEPRERAPNVDELAARLEVACGEPAMRRAQRPFVAPRPRGREALLDGLARRALDGASRGTVQVIHAARGMGKSTVLRELKWRLQLTGARVFELRAGEGALSPVGQLVRQVALAVPDAGATLLALEQAAAQGGQAQSSALGIALADALTALGPAPFVLLVDDLERAGTLLTQALLATLHRSAAQREHAPTIVGTAEELGAPGLASFVDIETQALAGLDQGDLDALIADALGPVDTATRDALSAHAAGNPGVLVEALAWLWERGDLTARGLDDLAPGVIGAGRAAARVARLSAPARELLLLLAVVRTPVALAALASVIAGDLGAAERELLHAGLAREADGVLFASEPVVNEWLRGADHAEAREKLARRACEHVAPAALDARAWVEVALAAQDRERLRSALPSALSTLRAQGATVAAVQLCEASLTLSREQEAELVLSELYVETGECTRAAELAERLIEAGTLSEPSASRARIAAARGHVASAQLDRAAKLLSNVSSQAPAPLRAQAARELARVHLRRGDFEQLGRAVAQGLAAAEVEEPARAELLALDATSLAQAGEGARADERFEQALTLARRIPALREEALVLGYRALHCERRGALAEARADYEAGLLAARRAGDLGLTATYASNLGNMSFRTGDLEGVEGYYTLASRLSRRSGRTSTALLADNNLAHLHVYLGSFARARVLAESSLAEAQRSGVETAEAHALQTLADVDARTGNREAALARYDAAAKRYIRLGRTHQLADAWLDAAEVLLDRGGVSDVSAASARLAQAREIIDANGHEEFRLRLRLLIARALAGNGDADGALKELTELARIIPKERERELLWQVLSAQAQLHAQLGSPLLAARKAREAAEIIELLAGQAPRDLREAFLADPRRRAALDLAHASLESSQRGASVDFSLEEPRFARLLELIKRLARERDLDRLLERITDAAVDLSGAERGFVLLVAPSGELAPHIVRASGGVETDPLVAFSRSIAEAVLIDGEPIVTVDARDDRRLNEFMSVHKLMLKSVACIPISGPTGVVGVLYLEHRLRVGRFQESDVDLLVAFADQAAIAIENARLWSELQRRQQELEVKASELAQANSEIERLLESRTVELEEARRDLGRARAELEQKSSRHGIVGRSPAMKRVFALIDRVADSPVPIVIEGESGTGKELVARAIHFSGARKKEPFVALNCAALPEQLLESELFGHVRGAFTGADRDKKGLFSQANGGTIFLDEFADVPPRMQVDLLRVLQERTIRPVGAEQDIAIDVRVIAATNRPLKQLVANGRVREDLYYRMSVVEIRLPALRERLDDLPLLCDHLLARLAERHGGRPRKLSRAALERILASELPGNVRQLEHLLTSAAMLADGPLIEPCDLGLGDDDNTLDQASSLPPGEADAQLPSDVNGFKSREKQRILDALEKHGWNRAKAATALGMPRRTFYRRLTEFNIL